MRVFQAVAELHHQVDERVPTYGAVPNQPFIQGPRVNVFNKDPRAVLDIANVIARRNIGMKADIYPCLSLFQKQRSIFFDVTQPVEQGFHRHHDIPAAVANHINSPHSAVFDIPNFVEVFDNVSNFPFTLLDSGGGGRY